VKGCYAETDKYLHEHRNNNRGIMRIIDIERLIEEIIEEDIRFRILFRGNAYGEQVINFTLHDQHRKKNIDLSTMSDEEIKIHVKNILVNKSVGI